SAPFSRALVAHHAKSTRAQGADVVMKSSVAKNREPTVIPKRTLNHIVILSEAKNPESTAIPSVATEGSGLVGRNLH
ncbi:MAG: hypothetical protein WA542_06400, partial [Candidatus Acidiferrum sp.]